jgi:ssDNA-binding Zn-finger/Zn-ribbon topoisomerase 1
MTPEELARIDGLLADPTWESVFEAKPNVEDVTFESLPAKYPGARQDLLCGECQAKMDLRTSPKFARPFYGCTRFPECKGTHGAHPNGAPLGIPANHDTKQSRRQAHAVFDQIWKQHLVKNRWAAYNWMRQAMSLSESQAHISMFNSQQCAELMRLVCRDFPELKTKTDRLLYDDNPFGFEDEEPEAYPF